MMHFLNEFHAGDDLGAANQIQLQVSDKPNKFVKASYINKSVTNQFCTFQAETRRGKVSAHRMIHKLFSKRQLWPKLRELRPKPSSTHGFCPPWTSFPARLVMTCEPAVSELMMKSRCIPLESQTR